MFWIQSELHASFTVQSLNIGSDKDDTFGDETDCVSHETNDQKGTMTLCIDTQLTLRDLETYIKVQLDDPRYSQIGMDPVLDIILHAKKRLIRGDYMPRVVSESMVSLDEYLMLASDRDSACLI